jgi:hypothetical protein
MRAIEFATSCDRLRGSGEYPMFAISICPSQAMYRSQMLSVSSAPAVP